MKIKVKKKFKWLAMDSGGAWFFYTRKPQEMTSYWCSIPDKPVYANCFIELPVGIPWNMTLHKRSGNKWKLHSKSCPQCGTAVV